MERQEIIDALQNVNQAEVGVFVYFVMKMELSKWQTSMRRLFLV